MLYEYTSAAANNGSGFEGLGDNTYFWNYTCGIVLILGRFMPIVGQVAIAGLAGQKEIYSGKCRHAEDRYSNFRCDDICRYLYCGCLVILPGTCIEYDC